MCKSINIIGKEVIVAVLIMVLATTGAFAWSLSDAAKSYRGITLRMVTETTPPSDALWHFVNEFETATGIKVIFERLGHPELEEKATMDFVSNAGIYDIYNMDTADVGRCVESGFFRPVRPFIEDKNLTSPDFTLEDFMPRGVKGCSEWNGVLYGLPFDNVVEFWAYRGDLFNEYGVSVPDSWDELRSVVEKLTLDQNGDGKIDLYGLGMMGRRFISINWDYFFYLWGAGGEIYNAEYIPQVNSSESIAALKFWKSLMKYAPPGVTTWDYNEVRDAFAQGIIATGIEWDDQLEQLENPAKSKVVGKMSYDTFPGRTASMSRTAHYGGSSLVIPSSSKHPEAAWLFVQWATSPEIQFKAAPYGYHPTIGKFYTQPDMKAKYPKKWRMYDIEYRAARVMNFRPQIPEWGAMREAMMKQLSKFLVGQITAEQCATTMNAELTELLSSRIK